MLHASCSTFPQTQFPPFDSPPTSAPFYILFSHFSLYSTMIASLASVLSLLASSTFALPNANIERDSGCHDYGPPCSSCLS
jgi:hypothetical protein